MNLAEPETTPGEWESRALCPDDSCIGVLGADGRCGVCGRLGEPGAPGQALHESAPDAPEASDDSAEPPTTTTTAADAGTSGDELGERELCPDDSCIGVLDAHGSCKVCGASRPGLTSDGSNDSDN